MAVEHWNFDLVHSSISFWVRHLMISKVHGRFQQWTGSLEFDDQNPTSAKVEVQLEAGSIDTKEPQRDAHLRSADFLEADKYPHITFKSTAISRSGSELSMAGDLTVHGVTKPVTLAVEYAGRVKDPWGGERIGFTAKTSLNRADYGLTWNKAIEAGGVVVGDKVEIEIEVEAVRKTEAAK
jgi:polyisoprenoid-binding protein YceI